MPTDTRIYAAELIKHIAEVAHVVGWQANVGASEIAGQIVSRLARDPDLIPRFMAEGSALMIDGNFIDGHLDLGETARAALIHAKTVTDLPNDR